MKLTDSSAITLAIARIRKSDAQIQRTEKQANSLHARYRAGKVSQEHFTVQNRVLVKQLEREISLDHDALRDFYEAVMENAGQSAYESNEEELAQLLSLSAAGGVR